MDHYDEIARIAYDLFERDGMVHGKDFHHWIEAEIIVLARHEERHRTEPEKDAKISRPKKKTSTQAAAKKGEAKPKAAGKTAAKTIKKG